MGRCSSPKVSDGDPESITDPALLVKGRRYAIRDIDHPEHAGSVGVFDEIRPSQWDGEPSVHFTDGEIGDVPQSNFAHPVTRRCEYTEVVDFFLEPTTFDGLCGGRVRADGPDGIVEGIVTEIAPGSFYAIAVRRSRVVSLSAPGGWKWADETFAGLHDDMPAAARAVHFVYCGEKGPREL